LLPDVPDRFLRHYEMAPLRALVLMVPGGVIAIRMTIRKELSRNSMRQTSRSGDATTCLAVTGTKRVRRRRWIEFGRN